MALPGELEGQAGLARPGLAAQQNDPAASRLELRPGGVQGLPLVGPPDELEARSYGQLGWQGNDARGNAPARLLGWLPCHFEHVDRLGNAVQRSSAEVRIAVTSPIPGQGADDLADQDLSVRRRILEPGGDDDGKAEAGTPIPAHIARCQ